MDDFLIGIGKRIRIVRKKQNITISTLANNAGVSNGLISKIENGRTIPSLPVLLQIINALEVDVSVFFESIEFNTGARFIHIKKEDQQFLEKEIEAKGFTYHHIFSKTLNNIGFEAVILTLDPNSQREKVVTDAWEFKYIISGRCTYLIENEEVDVSEGDSLYFNGRLPHVPVNTGNSSCTMLVVYFYSEGH